MLIDSIKLHSDTRTARTRFEKVRKVSVNTVKTLIRPVMILSSVSFALGRLLRLLEIESSKPHPWVASRLW